MLQSVPLSCFGAVQAPFTRLGESESNCKCAQQVIVRADARCFRAGVIQGDRVGVQVDFPADEVRSPRWTSAGTTMVCEREYVSSCPATEQGAVLVPNQRG